MSVLRYLLSLSVLVSSSYAFSEVSIGQRFEGLYLGETATKKSEGIRFDEVQAKGKKKKNVLVLSTQIRRFDLTTEAHGTENYMFGPQKLVIFTEKGSNQTRNGQKVPGLRLKVAVPQAELGWPGYKQATNGYSVKIDKKNQKLIDVGVGSCAVTDEEVDCTIMYNYFFGEPGAEPIDVEMIETFTLKSNELTFKTYANDLKTREQVVQFDAGTLDKQE